MTKLSVFLGSSTTQTKTCECYSNPTIDHIVRCTEKEALLKLGYCMTYEVRSGFYINLCENMISSLNITKDNYTQLPSNISDLNDYMCGDLTVARVSYVWQYSVKVDIPE